MKKIAIIQSNYIPWKGYIDLIAFVDEFIIYDDMQFTTRDWRNRNIIKTPQGPLWLTIPVGSNRKRKIREVEVSGDWPKKHWTTIKSNYCKYKNFEEIGKWLEPLYLNCKYDNLSQVNRAFIERICEYLEIETVIKNSWDYNLTEGKSERLVNLCIQAEADVYISGPAAKDYLDEGKFSESGVEVKWFDYSSYPEYQQLWGPFIHHVSILDLLFSAGKDTRKFMRCV